MSAETSAPRSDKRLPWGQIAFLAILFLIGISYAASIIVRSSNPLSGNVAKEAQDYLRSKNVKPLSDPLEKLLANPEEFLVKTQAHPLLGQPAPGFELNDHRQKPWRLSDGLAKGPLVLVFYYGYRCNHCVGQLFALNDDIGRFHELGAEVVSLSADAPETTRERFMEYGEFSFPVLSDPGNKIAQVYGLLTPVKGKGRGVLQHGTFVIARDGIVHWAQYGREPFTGNRALLYEVARLESQLSSTK